MYYIAVIPKDTREYDYASRLRMKRSGGSKEELEKEILKYVTKDPDNMYVLCQIISVTSANVEVTIKELL